jgi:hypothetical protein
MNRLALSVIALVVLVMSACTTAAPTPTTPLPTKPPAAPTVMLPTETSAPTPTLATVAAPTNTPTLTPSITPSPAPTLPPGLFVTGLRIEPNPPTRGTDLTFYATFANTTGAVQNYKWLVYIYKTDTPNRSFSETSALQSAIPTGTNELKSLGAWKLSLGGPCDYFFARVARLDQDNKPVMFTRPDGQVYEKGFTVCAPSDLPPPSPAPTATPTPTPTFAPGLFAMDLRTEPSPPTRGADLTFYATFANTTGYRQYLKWIVYLYKPGERNSFGETTATTNWFAVGINEYQSAGYWKLPLGGPCEDFIARVAWFDNGKVQMFTVFENQVFEKTLTICPP